MLVYTYSYIVPNFASASFSLHVNSCRTSVFPLLTGTGKDQCVPMCGPLEFQLCSARFMCSLVRVLPLLFLYFCTMTAFCWNFTSHAGS